MKRMPVCLMCLMCLFAALLWRLSAAPAVAPGEVETGSAVRSVMQAEEVLRNIPLREVIFAATGRKVRPLQPDKIAADASVLAHLRQAGDEILTFLNAPSGPAGGLRRINEASRHAEDQLVKLLNRGDFTCGFPRNAAGGVQRSGYPDLRLVHKPSGRVYFLDPKLYEAASATGSLRTFYYEPGELTGKIHDDACHLVLGISHDGVDGAWKFAGWKLVDLYEFRVRLKAEFHASNRDLYRKEFLAAESGDENRK